MQHIGLNYNRSTSMHSGRMRTARLLPVSPSMHCAGGGVVSAWGGLLQGEWASASGLGWLCVSQHALGQTPPL